MKRRTLREIQSAGVKQQFGLDELDAIHPQYKPVVAAYLLGVRYGYRAALKRAAQEKL